MDACGIRRAANDAVAIYFPRSDERERFRREVVHWAEAPQTTVGGIHGADSQEKDDHSRPSGPPLPGDVRDRPSAPFGKPALVY